VTFLQPGHNNVTFGSDFAIIYLRRRSPPLSLAVRTGASRSRVGRRRRNLGGDLDRRQSPDHREEGR